MHDFQGTKLEVGDLVATTSMHYKNLVVARVVGFTKKMIRVELVDSSNYIQRSGTVTLKEPSTVVKIHAA